MPGFYSKWLDKVLVFEVQLSHPKRRLFKWMLQCIICEYQKYSGSFLFEGLKTIVVTKRPHAEAVKHGGVYLQTESTIYLQYVDDIRLDSLMAAHELMHKALEVLFNGMDDCHRDANNLVHYAANVGEPFIFTKKLRYFVRQTRTMYPPMTIYFFNMSMIITNTLRIKNEIRGGYAPKGANPYFEY